MSERGEAPLRQMLPCFVACVILTNSERGSVYSSWSLLRASECISSSSETNSASTAITDVRVRSSFFRWSFTKLVSSRQAFWFIELRTSSTMTILPGICTRNPKPFSLVWKCQSALNRGLGQNVTSDFLLTHVLKSSLLRDPYHFSVWSRETSVKNSQSCLRKLRVRSCPYPKSINPRWRHKLLAFRGDINDNNGTQQWAQLVNWNFWCLAVKDLGVEQGRLIAELIHDISELALPEQHRYVSALSLFLRFTNL